MRLRRSGRRGKVDKMRHGIQIISTWRGVMDVTIMLLKDLAVREGAFEGNVQQLVEYWEDFQDVVIRRLMRDAYWKLTGNLGRPPRRPVDGYEALLACLPEWSLMLRLLGVVELGEDGEVGDADEWRSESLPSSETED